MAGYIAMNEIPIISSMFSCLNECILPGGISSFVLSSFTFKSFKIKETAIGLTQLQIQTATLNTDKSHMVQALATTILLIFFIEKISWFEY